MKARSKNSLFALFSTAALALLAIPNADATAVSVNGTCEIGNCSSPDALTQIGSTSAWTSIPTTTFSFVYSFPNGDQYGISGTYFATYSEATGSTFVVTSNATYIGSSPSKGDTLTIDFLQNIVDNNPGNYNGTYNETGPTIIGANAGNASFSQNLFYDGEAVGMIGPFTGPGSYNGTASNNLTGLTAATLAIDFRFTETFPSGLLPGASISSPLSIASSPLTYVISGTEIEVFKSGAYQLQFGGTGYGNGQFQLPSGIAVDSTGNVYVTDATLNRVQKFSPTGTYISQFGSTGFAPGFLYHPYGIAIDSAGNIWVADTGNNRIEQFSPTGTFLQSIGTLGGGNGQFYAPVGIAIDSSNNIYVADTGNDRVEKFAATVIGTGVASTVSFSLKFGTYGNANGTFNGDYGLAIDPSGNVWVGDSANQRLEEFTSGGAFIQSVTGPFSYPSPYGVAADSFGNIWAVDYSTNQVFEFNSAGAKIFAFGTTGGGQGQLIHPTYIAVH